MTDSPVVERCRWQARIGAHARHLRACQDCRAGYACLEGDAALDAIQRAYRRFVAARALEVPA